MANSDKKRWVALSLCFFLGYMGIHRFYVGKVGTGILYMMTLGFLGIGILIDFVMILCGVFQDEHGHYLR